jgi:hypothetical protein
MCDLGNYILVFVVICISEFELLMPYWHNLCSGIVQFQLAAFLICNFARYTSELCRNIGHNHHILNHYLL